MAVTEKTNTTLLWRILLIIGMGPSGAVLTFFISATLIDWSPVRNGNMGDGSLGVAMMAAFYSFWVLIGFSIVAPFLAFRLQGKVLRNTSLIIASPVVVVPLFVWFCM